MSRFALRATATVLVALALPYVLALAFAVAARAADLDPAVADAVATLLGALGPWGSVVAGIVLLVHFTAKAIVAATATPDPATLAGKLYAALEVAALVVGKVKDRGPSLGAVLALGLALGLGACAIPGGMATAGAGGGAATAGAVVLSSGAAIDDAAAATREAVKIACAGVAFADASFKAAAPSLVETGDLDKSALSTEAIIFGTVEAACGTPPADPAATLAAVVGASAQIYALTQRK
jgi:hypothetical protein